MYVLSEFSLSILPFSAALPLDVNVEGPGPNDTYVIVLGARPIAQGMYDRYLNGFVAGVSIFDEKPAAGFALCTVGCLESVTIDTAGTAVTSPGYDAIDRRLVLNGPAPDSDYQKVIQSLVYFSNANSLNVTEATVSYVDNGVVSSDTAAVTVVGNQRRRRSVGPPLSRRHLLSVTDDFNGEVEASETDHSLRVAMTYMWCLVVLAVVIVAMVAIWRRRASSDADL